MEFELEIPVSVGELLDKITILQIKTENITDEKKLTNIGNELRLLLEKKNDMGLGHRADLNAVEARLKDVNSAIWNAEDAIRDLERQGDFGADFVAIARSIYRLNDARAQAKREINELSGSLIVEEKGYNPY
jgi:hypothetical protein